MPEWLVALLGVVVGFALNQVAIVVSAKRKASSLKAALEDELNTNLHQLVQKEEITSQMMEALNNNRFLAGTSVPFASVVYEHHFPEIIETLSSIQRDNVRHIYSNLRVLDELTANLESEFKQDKESGIHANITDVYLGRIDDIHSNYGVLKDLIGKYLKGKPVDIYRRDEEGT